MGFRLIPSHFGLAGSFFGRSSPSSIKASTDTLAARAYCSGAMRERRGRYSLFYFEQIGSRSCLRITRLGLILVLLFTVIPTIALLSLFLINRSTSPPDVAVKVKPMPTANAATYPVIKQQLPAPTQKAAQQPASKQPSPPTLSTPPVNGSR